MLIMLSRDTQKVFSQPVQYVETSLQKLSLEIKLKIYTTFLSNTYVFVGFPFKGRQVTHYHVPFIPIILCDDAHIIQISKMKH